MMGRQGDASEYLPENPEVGDTYTWGFQSDGHEHDATVVWTGEEWVPHV